METLHEKIRRLREAKMLTQEQMANSLGISRVAYSQIENNITKSISINVGKKIASVLDQSFSELFEIDSPPSDLEELRSKYLELKQNAVISVFMYIENSISLKALAYDPNNEAEKKEFENYQQILKGCKDGIFQTFISLGVCSMDEIKGILKAYIEGKI